VYSAHEAECNYKLVHCPNNPQCDVCVYSAHEAECDYKPVHCPNNPQCPIMIKKVCFCYLFFHLLSFLREVLLDIG